MRVRDAESQGKAKVQMDKWQAVNVKIQKKRKRCISYSITCKANSKRSDSLVTLMTNALSFFHIFFFFHIYFFTFILSNFHNVQAITFLFIVNTIRYSQTIIEYLPSRH